MKTIKLAFASVAIFALTACGSSAPPSTDTLEDAGSSHDNGNSAEPAVDKSAAIKEYFDAYATSDPEDMRSAAENAATDSPAQKYMIHQANLVEAHDAMGYERFIQDAEYEDDSVFVCYEGDDCGEFSDITFDGGKLSSFFSGGKDISSRVALGDGSVIKYEEDAGFEVLSSYQASGDDLFAVVRFYAYDRPMDFGYTPTYRKPNGQQIDSTESELPSRVAANSNQDAVLTFPNSENGGDLHLNLSNADDEDEVEGGHIFDTVEVPLPQG